MKQYRLTKLRSGCKPEVSVIPYAGSCVGTDPVTRCEVWIHGHNLGVGDKTTQRVNGITAIRERVE